METKQSILNAEKIFFEYMGISKYPSHKIILNSSDIVQMIANGIESVSGQSNVGVHDVEEFYKDVCECHAPTYRDKYGDHRCTQCEMLANRD